MGAFSLKTKLKCASPTASGVTFYPLVVGEGTAAVPTGWAVWPVREEKVPQPQAFSTSVTLAAFGHTEAGFVIVPCLSDKKQSINCRSLKKYILKNYS